MNRFETKAIILKTSKPIQKLEGDRWAVGYESIKAEKVSFSVYFLILIRPWEVNIDKTVFLLSFNYYLVGTATHPCWLEVNITSLSYSRIINGCQSIRFYWFLATHLCCLVVHIMSLSYSGIINGKSGLPKYIGFYRFLTKQWPHMSKSKVLYSNDLHHVTLSLLIKLLPLA